MIFTSPHTTFLNFLAFHDYNLILNMPHLNSHLLFSACWDFPKALACMKWNWTGFRYDNHCCMLAPCYTTHAFYVAWKHSLFLESRRRFPFCGFDTDRFLSQSLALHNCHHYKHLKAADFYHWKSQRGVLLFDPCHAHKKETLNFTWLA